MLGRCAHNFSIFTRCGPLDTSLSAERPQANRIFSLAHWKHPMKYPVSVTLTGGRADSEDRGLHATRHADQPQSLVKTRPFRP